MASSNKGLLWIGACGLMLAILVGPGSARSEDVPKAGTGQVAPHKGKMEHGKLSSVDMKFMRETAMGGLAEVELGKLAQQRAQNTEVKDFGSRMVKDHGKVNQELMQLAARHRVTLPTEMGRKHMMTKERLQKVTGAEFDRTYMREMIVDHNRDITSFRRQSERGDNVDLKKWAANTLPTLQQHLRLAEQINQRLQERAAKK